jgi:hypothetical protein
MLGACRHIQKKAYVNIILYEDSLTEPIPTLHKAKLHANPVLRAGVYSALVECKGIEN